MLEGSPREPRPNVALALIAGAVGGPALVYLAVLIVEALS